MPGMGPAERNQKIREGAAAAEAAQTKEFLRKIHLQALADKGLEKAKQFHGEAWTLEQVKKDRDDAGAMLIQLVQEGDPDIMGQFHYQTWEQLTALVRQVEDQQQ